MAGSKATRSALPNLSARVREAEEQLIAMGVMEIAAEGGPGRGSNTYEMRVFVEGLLVDPSVFNELDRYLVRRSEVKAEVFDPATRDPAWRKWCAAKARRRAREEEQREEREARKAKRVRILPHLRTDRSAVAVP